MSTTTTPRVKRGQSFTHYRTRSTRDFIGFTTRPDGVKRARLTDGANEYRVRADQLLKSYRPIQER